MVSLASGAGMGGELDEEGNRGRPAARVDRSKTREVTFISSIGFWVERLARKGKGNESTKQRERVVDGEGTS